jgi:hypothetical protein
MGNFISQEYLADLGIDDNAYKNFLNELNNMKGPSDIKDYEYEVLKTIPNVYNNIIKDINGRISNIHLVFKSINVFNDNVQEFKDQLTKIVKEYKLTPYQITYFTKQLEAEIYEADKLFTANKITYEEKEKYQRDLKKRIELIKGIQSQVVYDRNVNQQQTNLSGMKKKISDITKQNGAVLSYPAATSETETGTGTGTGTTVEKSTSVGVSSTTPQISISKELKSPPTTPKKKVRGGGRKTMSTFYMDYE